MTTTRRTSLLYVALCAAPAVIGLPRTAFAHHGFVGHYDTQHPLYLSGTVIHTSYGMPHGRIRVRVDDRVEPAQDQALQRSLEDAEGRQIGTSLRAIARTGVYEVTLDTKPSRQLTDQPFLLATGDPTSLIAYRRQGNDEYRDELLAVAILLNDGTCTVGSARMRPQRRRVPAP